MRGKRLFNAACASCHVGGGTRTNQNHGFIGAPRVCMKRNDESSGCCPGTSAWPSRSSAARSPTAPPSKARSVGSREVPWRSPLDKFRLGGLPEQPHHVRRRRAQCRRVAGAWQLIFLAPATSCLVRSEGHLRGSPIHQGRRHLAEDALHEAAGVGPELTTFNRGRFAVVCMLTAF